MGKILNFVGLEEVEEEEEDRLEAGEERGMDWQDEVPRKRRAGLVPLPQSRGFRVVVTHPRSFEDGQVIADQVKGRRPVIVNFDQADERSAQRLLNFLSGVAYALDGGLRKVGDGIFLLTPSNIEVAAEESENGAHWGRGL
ncbi:MAG: cell division protein SepF [Firmicutes bacterium]|nr:cell division protein SepF [Alicyclobacillaceae bacterium]MCL6497748.1 cell division protein SepF [Bacillota bacterium]